VQGITINDLQPKQQINVDFEMSKRKALSIENIEPPDSMETETSSRSEKANPSMNVTFRGITIDFNEDDEIACDSIRFNCEFHSNETDETDVDSAQHEESRISTV
jgi:hypothetical protein